jgi:uncharacterized membrane protein required for colicin V production
VLFLSLLLTIGILHLELQIRKHIDPFATNPINKFQQIQNLAIEQNKSLADLIQKNTRRQQKKRKRRRDKQKIDDS